VSGVSYPFTAADAALCAKIPGWFPFPNGLDALRACYGNIQVRNGQVVTPGWEDDHMESWRADWMPKGRLYINKRVRPIFEDAFNACLALKDGYQIKSLSCFAPRAKRVNGDLSVHSWGAAIDLNADTNPLSTDGILRTDIPPAWIAEFEKRGLRWGGRFAKPDAMHFQAVTGY
jgi:hypothetical protein